MYYGHFGLDQAPFKITPNTGFFFSGGNRGPILEALIYAISHGEGIVKVTGEVGSGKTMLCNMLPARLPPNIETVYLATPSVSPDEILHAIAFELQLGLDRDAGRLEVMQALQNHLLARHADGKRVVVFVEESQSMPLATLEEIRLLSNLETKSDKLLQIVLFGQPELDDNLRQPNIRQLRERITHSFRLEPLDTNEIREYLMFRIRAAGYHGPDLFSSAVVKAIARASDGLTRRVNLIADKALLAAFSENTHTIKLKHVEAAIRDSEFSQHTKPASRPRYAWAAGLVLAGAALGIAAYEFLQREHRPAATIETGPASEVEIAPAPAADSAMPSAVAAAAPAPLPTKEKNLIESNTYENIASTPPTTSESPPVSSPPAAGIPSASVPAEPAAAPAAPAAVADDIVQARFAATQKWLADAAASTVSIQLMGIADEQQLKHHLNVIGKFVEINDVFVYRTIAKQKPSITVLYGSFSDHRSAQEALAGLPPFLKANRPILRTVQGVRTEIGQHQSS
ncbi:MAG: AAA family ATPase [Burkholderiales bacterium]|nr:AAA family ATPase [Burkholderiales bacterium]